MKVYPPAHIDTSSLKTLWMGGDIVTKNLVEGLRKALPHAIITHGYGLTEATGSVTFFNFSNNEDLLLWRKNMTSCGRIRPGLEWKVSMIPLSLIIFGNCNSLRQESLKEFISNLALSKPFLKIKY